jgi:small subunit ribosomal protein S7
MPRKGTVPVRDVAADPIHQSQLVEKFINCMMWDGKKSTSQQIFYTAMDKIGAMSNGEEPLKVFKKAIENVKPLLEVKTRRVGGANYQVPVEVTTNRRTSLAIRWIIGFARGRGEKGMIDKLAAELVDAANNRGSAVKKKEDTHRMAEANKAFAHYRW